MSAFIEVYGSTGVMLIVFKVCRNISKTFICCIVKHIEVIIAEYMLLKAHLNVSFKVGNLHSSNVIGDNISIL